MAHLYGENNDLFRNLRSRVFLLTACVFTIVFVLIIRLWYLQIVQAGNLRKLAENNRLRQIILPDYRGGIFDRNGVELVSLRGSFDVVLIREDVSDLDAVLDRLAELIPFDKTKTREEIRSRPAFMPYTISYDVDRDKAATIEEHRYELPGVYLDVLPVRNYRYDHFASHLLGYLGEISKSEMSEGFYEGYLQGDIVGKYGIEKSFEPLLYGRKGKKIVEVDATGRELRLISKTPAGAGKDIHLSIEFNAQTAAEKAMEGKRGAVVAMRPSTGEILAMASSPSFNPNEFAHGVPTEYWKKLISDNYHPLNNRAIQGQYSPGSTYKIVVAAAGLAEGLISEETTFYCPGHYTLGRKTYRCWKKAGHGKIDLITAIEQSCDVFFYQVGLKVGVNKIAKMARQFGLNVITGINLDHEKNGLIPTTTWKEKYRNEPWIAGETLSIAIGQGFNLVTPLQMARVAVAVANGGWIPTPRLTHIPEGTAIDRDALGGNRLDLSDEQIETLRKGMYAVVNHPRGTGGRSRIKGITVAGKTGTSQVVRMKEDDEREGDEIPERFRDHAWFIAYAPFEHPEIAVAVVVEHGGHGGSAAAPVAREVIEAYMESLKRNETHAAAAGEKAS